MSEKAKEIYFSMKEYGVSPDIIHFNCLIKALIENGESEEAMNIYRQEKELIPNEVTFILLLKGCAITRSLVNGKKLHETIMKNYELYRSITVQNNLINMFSKCGETQTAIELFMKMLKTKQLDDTTWTLIIPTYCEEGRLEEIESIIISEGVTSVFVFNVLLDSFLKSGKVEHAESIFNQMEFKDVITWNSFLKGCSQNGDTKRLLLYFKIMPKYTQPNDVTMTVMLTFFANHSMEQEACFLFDNMNTLFKIARITAHYGCMIKLWANLKKMPEAISLYEDMINNNLVPDVPTLILLLSVCSEFGNLDFGKIIHRNISELRIRDHNLFNALINMYAKCGDLTSAHEVFLSVPNKDVVSWTCIINAYAIHGMGLKAIELLNQMSKENIKPNEHTLTCVLHACGHCGMVDEAKEIYNHMESKYSIKPSNIHLACLIDALARKGNIKEAEKLLGSCISPDVVTVSTLFGVCRKFNNVTLAEKLFNMLIERNEVESSHFILMANIYASQDMYEDAKRVKELMEFGGFKKLPSMTQVCIEGKMHSFVCEEKEHPEIKMIEKELKKMVADLIKAGYQPDLSWVIKNVDTDAEKLDLLYKHSEKIAMAYAFNKQPNTSTIHLTTNLRVCGDCHNATKLLSAVRNCEIIIRDASRFHHFKDGKCTCGDYW
ncbi:predicted protein [Naegleria gruberi]|uniref:Predicted protein n=1 Tax=Naegleria gruberi TaxID=5762 RepID=D2VN29_NAEGR|nr:uncharacterized protein NAEGRDRAFT_70351 [Naegleria gruberi]EFC41923.1 predicted protein [Naegleria gruberi]|eukprot:XP_002674667.1 predicted protein [Naegleria gruberi strain NEG-M]